MDSSFGMAHGWKGLSWRVPSREDANKLGRAQRGERKTIRGQENLRFEGNGERILREDVPRALRGIISLQRKECMVLHVCCR